MVVFGEREIWDFIIHIFRMGKNIKLYFLLPLMSRTPNNTLLCLSRKYVFRSNIVGQLSFVVVIGWVEFYINVVAG